MNLMERRSRQDERNLPYICFTTCILMKRLLLYERLIKWIVSKFGEQTEFAVKLVHE